MRKSFFGGGGGFKDSGGWKVHVHLKLPGGRSSNGHNHLGSVGKDEDENISDGNIVVTREEQIWMRMVM